MLLRLPAALAAALMTVSCAGAPGPVDRPQAQARAALAGLVSDYESGAAERFFERFDQSRFPNYEGYRDSVRQFLIHARQVTLDVVVDGVDANGADVGVRSHWNKGFVNAQGMHQLAHGECEFVFGRRPSGGLLLRGIQGASPF